LTQRDFTGHQGHPYRPKSTSDINFDVKTGGRGKGQAYKFLKIAELWFQVRTQKKITFKRQLAGNQKGSGETASGAAVMNWYPRRF